MKAPIHNHGAGFCNRIREIIGASKIVETVMGSALDAFFAAKSIPPQASQWVGTQRDARGRTVRRARPFTFGGSRADAEVLYHGGGNMVVAYASKTLAQEAYRHLARTVLQETIP